MTIPEGLLVQRRLHQIHEQSVYQRRCQRSISSCKDDDGVKWYIPHHGVYHPKKYKTRVVFDCSVRFKGTSLNDHLLSGPDLTNNLTLYSADSEDILTLFLAMWRCFTGLFDYLRFLWLPNGEIKQEPKEYRMKVHSFGATTSPCCPSYRFKYMDSQGKEAYPSAARICCQKNFL